MFWKSIKLYQAFEEKLGQSTIGYRFNQLNYYFHSIMFMKLLLSQHKIHETEYHTVS